MLTKQYIDGPKVTALDHDAYFSDAAIFGFSHINGKVPKTLIIENETFCVFGFADEHGMGDGRICVSAIAYDHGHLALGQKFRSSLLEGLSGCTVCIHQLFSPLKMLEYAS
jgi:hypothetical protein